MEVGPQYFLWCLSGAGQLSLKNNFALLCFLSSGPLDGELWLGIFFFFCTWQYFWVASFFSSKFGIYQTEKEPRQLAVIPWVLRSVTHLPSSLHLSKSSYVSFYVNVQNFSLNLPRELGTSTTSSSSSRSFPCVHFIMSFITLSL